MFSHIFSWVSLFSIQTECKLGLKLPSKTNSFVGYYVLYKTKRFKEASNNVWLINNHLVVSRSYPTSKYFTGTRTKGDFRFIRSFWWSSSFTHFLRIKLFFYQNKSFLKLKVPFFARGYSMGRLFNKLIEPYIKSLSVRSSQWAHRFVFKAK